MKCAYVLKPSGTAENASPLSLKNLKDVLLEVLTAWFQQD
jgi:hypothetical protein